MRCLASLVGVTVLLGKGYRGMCDRSGCNRFTAFYFVTVLTLLQVYDFAISNETNGSAMLSLANEVGARVPGTKFLLSIICVGTTSLCKLRGTQEKVSMSSRCVPAGS